MCVCVLCHQGVQVCVCVCVCAVCERILYVGGGRGGGGLKKIIDFKKKKRKKQKKRIIHEASYDPHTGEIQREEGKKRKKKMLCKSI